MRFAFARTRSEAAQASCRRLVSHGLTVIGTAVDTTLLTGAATPVVPAPAIDGWIVGEIFSRHDGAAVAELPTAAQLAIASTGGRHLLERWFGRYIAYWRSHGSARPCMLRDPSAFARAVRYRDDHIDCLASDPELLTIAAGTSPRIDWPSLAHHLRFPELPTRDTCLADVEELFPGEVVSDDATGVLRHQRWRPGDFAAADPTPDAPLPDHLRATVDMAVRAWSTRRRTILLEMSGGLDSSIIASSLTASGATWTGLTIATIDPDGDERDHARRVARHLDAPLVERRLEDARVDPLVQPARLTPRPGGVAAQRGFGTFVGEVAAEVGAETLMSGTGGDNVFCFLGSSAPVLDAWRRLGWRRAVHVAGDIATQTGTTRADVGARTLRRALSALWRDRRWQPDDSLLADASGTPARRHPWLELERPLWHGRWGHIAALLRAQTVMHAHERAWSHDMVFPLLSQPVMEFCLSIPSWCWVDRGRDRSVARDAFRTRLPQTTIGRTRKGHLSTSIARAFDRCRGPLRTLLHDGLLADQRLIDLKTVDACLARPAGDDHRWVRVLELADAENWARYVAAYPAPR
jgi:asparagine synthase (glutamine-hydrolysing)